MQPDGDGRGSMPNQMLLAIHTHAGGWEGGRAEEGCERRAVRGGLGLTKLDVTGLGVVEAWKQMHSSYVNHAPLLIIL